MKSLIHFLGSFATVVDIGIVEIFQPITFRCYLLDNLYSVILWDRAHWTVSTASCMKNLVVVTSSTSVLMDS